MLCGALSFSRVRVSEVMLVMSPRRGIRISGGELGLRTLEHIVGAMKRALDEGHIHYGKFTYILPRARNIEAEGNI